MRLRPWVTDCLCGFVVVWATCSSLEAADDWRAFRGTEGRGVAGTSLVPTSWKEGENIAWSAELPGRGLSSPIVVGSQVIVTASSGFDQDRLHVFSFDESTGRLQWERQFSATGRTGVHPKTNVAAPTPVSDGQRIFAFYSSNDVFCLSLDGDLLWCRGLTYDYPNVSNSLGMASSPVVVDDTLVVQAENDSQSLAFGLDVETGEDRWKQDRPKRANWTSCCVVRVENRALALLQSSKGLTAVVPKTGEVAWSYDDGASTIPSLTHEGNMAFVPSHGITALRMSGAGAEQVWRAGKLSPGTASPLVVGNRVYVMNNAGVLVSANRETGEIVWQLRLPGPFSGTPVVIGSRLVAFNEKGVGIVVELGEKGAEIISENDLGEMFQCSPAVSTNGLFVRSDHKLWKISLSKP